jgi:hypothetical protein
MKEKHTMKTNTEILTKARDYVKAGWIKHSMAEDTKGNPVGIRDRKAKRFCTVGAIRKATPKDQDAEAVVELFRKANRISVPVENWNDKASRTKAQVTKAFTKAIVRARVLDKKAA